MFHRGEACVVLTLRCDAESAAALARSDSHTRTVSEILAAGFFQGEQTLETCDVHRLADLPINGAHIHKAPGQLEVMTKRLRATRIPPSWHVAVPASQLATARSLAPAAFSGVKNTSACRSAG